MAYTIQHSTVLSNREGLLTLLHQENKQHLIPEILNSLIEHHPDEQDRVPLSEVTQNIHTIAKIISDPCLGAKIIALVNPNHYILYQTLKHCTQILDKSGNNLPFNLLTMLISRYFSVITEVVRMDIQYHKHTVSIELISNAPQEVSYHQIEGSIVGLFRIIQSLSQVQIQSVEFSHPSPLNAGSIYQDIFSLLPQHNSDKNRMVFLNSHAVQGLDKNSLLTLNSIQSLLDSTFPNLKDHERCQHIIRSILSFGEPTRENVASIMNISISTLQRKLRGQNTSFKALLLNSRKTLAHELLLTHERNASDLAFLLGYQSTSQFFKAFKNWFGMTPREYKEQQIKK